MPTFDFLNFGGKKSLHFVLFELFTPLAWAYYFNLCRANRFAHSAVPAWDPLRRSIAAVVRCMYCSSNLRKERGIRNEDQKKKSLSVEA